MKYEINASCSATHTNTQTNTHVTPIEAPPCKPTWTAASPSTTPPCLCCDVSQSGTFLRTTCSPDSPTYITKLISLVSSNASRLHQKAPQPITSLQSRKTSSMYEHTEQTIFFSLRPMPPSAPSGIPTFILRGRLTHRLSLCGRVRVRDCVHVLLSSGQRDVTCQHDGTQLITILVLSCGIHLAL